MKPASILLALTLVACDKQQPVSHIPREEAVDLAREAAQVAFQQLSAELAKAIEHGGTEAAIPVCSTKAQALVSDVAATRKLTMIRLSDRPRNPKQAAGVEDLAAMENFRAAMKQGEAPSPAVLELPDG